MYGKGCDVYVINHLGWRDREQSFLKAQLLIQSIKKEL